MEVEEVGVERESLSASVRSVVQHPEMESQQNFATNRFAPDLGEFLTSKDPLEDQGGLGGARMFTQPFRLRLALFPKTHLKLQAP